MIVPSGARSAEVRRSMSHDWLRRSVRECTCARRWRRCAASAARCSCSWRAVSELMFDRVFFACHSDQALALLADASPAEREVLGAIPYQENEVVLHTDTRLLPACRRAWAAWNYHIARERAERVCVTYNMNILQGLDCPQTVCVTLNRSAAIDPDKVMLRLVLPPSAIYTSRRGCTGAPGRNQWRESQLFLWRLLAQRISRRRSGQRRERTELLQFTGGAACTAPYIPAGLAIGAERRARTRSASRCLWCGSTSPNWSASSKSVGSGAWSGVHWHLSFGRIISEILQRPWNAACGTWSRPKRGDAPWAPSGC